MLDVQGQIPITISEHWGARDPLRVLADALSGELNIAPTKISSDIQDEACPQRTDIDHERPLPDAITITEVKSRRNTGAARWNRRPTLLMREEEAPLSDDERRELLGRFVKAYPEHAPWLSLADADATDEEITKRHHCTRRTVINRRQRAIRRFQEFVRSVR
jgi:hypothetical protein